VTTEELLLEILVVLQRMERMQKVTMMAEVGEMPAEPMFTLDQDPPTDSE